MDPLSWPAREQRTRGGALRGRGLREQANGIAVCQEQSPPQDVATERGPMSAREDGACRHLRVERRGRLLIRGRGRRPGAQPGLGPRP